MFNFMSFVKGAAALIGSTLALLLLLWAGSALYHMGATQAHAEGEAVAQAYTIPIEGADDGAAAEEEAPVDFATLLASADAAKGEKVFGKCKACHKIDGKNGTGPHLDGVVDRAVASVPDYAYSDPMIAHAAEVPTWTPEAIDEFVAAPKDVVPDTKMTFAGLKKPEDRANLVAYLQSLN
ncbi:MAG: c-type cytochrome [Paracoccus sp. (in: a-proteobacteria)]